MGCWVLECIFLGGGTRGGVTWTWPCDLPLELYLSRNGSSMPLVSLEQGKLGSKNWLRARSTPGVRDILFVLKIENNWFSLFPVLLAIYSSGFSWKYVLGVSEGDVFSTLLPISSLKPCGDSALLLWFLLLRKRIHVAKQHPTTPHTPPTTPPTIAPVSLPPRRELWWLSLFKW